MSFRLVKIVFRCSTGMKAYGISSRIGGSSKQNLYDEYTDVFKNRALEYFKEYELKDQLPGVTLITTPEECRFCVEQLMLTNTIVAWDSQTIDLDIKNESPVGNGKILCASFFAGPQYDFGNGPRVFIDNFGKNAGLINYFKDYLQNQKYLKAWHNYSFDRHVFYNHNINVKGLGGDTMHMARLFDSGKMFGQYSLAALTKEYRKYVEPATKSYSSLIRKKLLTKMSQLNYQTDKNEIIHIQKQMSNLDRYQNQYFKTFRLTKIKMDELFKRKKILKNGTEGKSYQFPTTLTLHTNAQYIKDWVQYSIIDCESTFYLREILELMLKRDKAYVDKSLPDMWQLYKKFWRPFGQVLTDIERTGIKIDVQHMKNIEKQALNHLSVKKKQFIQFLKTFQHGKNIDHFNPSSSQQLVQLLHAPYIVVPPERKQKTTEQRDEQLNQYYESTVNRSQSEAYEEKSSSNRKPTSFEEVIKVFKIENVYPERGGPKKVQMEILGLGIPPLKFTPLGLPSVDGSVLEQFAGNPKNIEQGKAFQYFNDKGNPEFGVKISTALRKLIEYRNVETLVKNFILPLRGYADENDRVHCSLNINTQTGRLSCRKPNLQNQPALDKDIYKIRKAFIADKGKKFIVADYGQLELRILAHLTNCKAMIEAFESGGDFHSRTAISMYPQIKKQIQQGRLLLEWDKSKGEPPFPLLKEKYAAQRKQAKTVNFSIAYGKTATGFARDWGCSLEEAKEVIKKWFSDRQEVQKWQKEKQAIAERHKYTQTLLGRYRKLDKFFSFGDKGNMLKGMRMRRAINTPIQGGAADIVIASMIKIAQNTKLKELGWKILMQIHDQLIIEGPEQSSIEALELVKQDMENPFDKDLRVKLQIDAKIGDNWYDCK